MKPIMAFVLFFLAAASLCAQATSTPTPDMTQVTRVANQGLVTLRALAEKAPSALGLTAKEAAEARLGPPLRIFHVPLDRLRTYRPEEDPRALLRDIQSFFYPVVVGAEVRSSLTVKQQSGQWVASDFGQSALSKQVSTARGEASGPETTLVRVPALNVYFIGRTNGTFTLTPVTELHGLEYPVGRPAAAADVFRALSAIAEKLKGDPT